MNTLKSFVTCLLYIAGLSLTCPNGVARACGFWGDGDVGMINNDSGVDVEGRYLNQVDPAVAKGITETQIPGRRGFSFALRESTRAIPYNLAVESGKFFDIGELRAIGITSVVDLLPPSSEIHQHRAETLTSGIRYYSIPVETFPPHTDQINQFAKIVADPSNFPIIVYAGSSESLASLWSAYRFSIGVKQQTAVSEGKALGLRHHFEEELHWHLRNGKLTGLRPRESAR